MKLRKKVTVLFVLSFCIVFMAFIVHGYNIQAKKNEYIDSIKKYIVIGDSISEDTDDVFNINYNNLIYKFLKSLNSNLEYENLSTTNTDINDLNRSVNENKDKIRQADLIVLNIGEEIIINSINDNLKNKEDLNYYDDNESNISNNVNTVTLEEDLSKEVEIFKEEFLKTILNIKELSPQSEIYVNNIYNPLNDNEELYYFFENKIEEINSVIYQGYDDGLYKIIDVYKIFKDNNAYSLNYDLEKIQVTVNNNGHAILASEVIKNYEQYVKLDVNKIKKESNEIVGKTIPDSKVIALSKNGIIGTAEVEKNGNFHIDIPQLNSGSEIDLLIYDKDLFSILYTSKSIMVK